MTQKGSLPTYNTRAFRRDIALILCRTQPSIILNRDQPRAILIPLYLPNNWPTKGEKRAARAKAKRDLLSALSDALPKEK